jgi:RNA polymerase primary sigma factor/RNA polymerase nonessential primary-like sigma factor
MTVVERKRTTKAGARGSYDEPDLVGRYLREVGGTALLTAQDEVDLARRIEAGVYAEELLRQVDDGERTMPAPRRRALAEVARDGRTAKDAMVRANLRLVVSIAKKYANRGVPFLDVIQEGNLGLIRAVEKFDYAKGFKFSTYAVWWIRQAIDRGLAMQGRTIRLPVHVMEELAKLSRAERQLVEDLDRDPTDKELADATGAKVERVTELRRAGRETVSLDAPVGAEGDTQVADLIEDSEVVRASDIVEFQALSDGLRAVVDTLSQREALIVTLRYGLDGAEPCTLQEVAGRIGLTRERVRQLEKQAMAQLRDPERNQPLLAWSA